MILIFSIFLFLFLEQSQSQIEKNLDSESCLPDLKFYKTDYEYIKHSRPNSKPGMPHRRGYVGQIRAIRFIITIENIGTLDWDNDLYILYQFDDKINSYPDTIVIEDLLIPYALKESIELKINSPSGNPQFITFFLNTTKTDSLDTYKIFDEFYYKNNSIEVKLR